MMPTEAADMTKPTNSTTPLPLDQAEKPLKDVEHESSSHKKSSESETDKQIEDKEEDTDPASKNQDRLQRFKALQARAVS